MEDIDRCFKMYYKDATPEGLYGHVTDEYHELETAFMLNHHVSTLEEGWDVIFMVYGFLRSVAEKDEVIRMLKMVIDKNKNKIKAWDKT